jgi:hypothetical protein
MKMSRILKIAIRVVRLTKRIKHKDQEKINLDLGLLSIREIPKILRNLSERQNMLKKEVLKRRNGLNNRRRNMKKEENKENRCSNTANNLGRKNKNTRKREWKNNKRGKRS